MLQTMVDELTEAISTGGLAWKASSLEVLPGGPLAGSFSEPVTAACGEERLQYSVTSRLHLLGDLLDEMGSRETSRTHRQSIADAIYFKNKHAFQARGPVIPRLRAWHDFPATSAFFGSSTWHVTRYTSATLRSWEFGRLQMMFRLRRRPGEGQREYNQRTSLVITHWFKHSRTNMAYHSVLRGIFMHAWSERQSPCNFRENPLRWSREHRDARWWESIRCLTVAERRHEGVQHFRRGRQVTAWENQFVAAFGMDWRTKLDECKDC